MRIAEDINTENLSCNIGKWDNTEKDMHLYVLEEDSERLNAERNVTCLKATLYLSNEKTVSGKGFMLSSLFKIVILYSDILSVKCSSRRKGERQLRCIDREKILS